VHGLVGTYNGVYWTSLDAQCAAYTPSFINDGYSHWSFKAIVVVERANSLPSDLRQAADAFFAAGRALVNVRLPAGYGPRVGQAIRVVAA
jgi:hypothetical protein